MRTARDLKALRWLPLLVLLVNLAAVGLMRVYSFLNLRPFVPEGEATHLRSALSYLVLFSSVFFPTIAGTIYLRPVFRRLGQPWDNIEPTGPRPAPSSIVERAANAPLVLGLISLLGWIATAALTLFLALQVLSESTVGTWAHFLVRPLLAGLIAAVAVYFAAEYTCRTRVWPVLLASSNVQASRRVVKIRVAYRHLLLWLAISFIPLSVIVLITVARMDAVGAWADPLLVRVMTVIIFCAASASLGGAWLAWLMSRSIDRPLRRLETAMERLRRGDLGVRVTMSGPDEIGALETGFNLMAQRLKESYEALEKQNRELADALHRVTFLESVKRGLDRFVPDTVRRLIAEHPDAPDLSKMEKDVTIMFLDIEGYTHLSEMLSRGELTETVERYFSLYLSDIRAGGGDVNETAGDGLMIIFQADQPEEHARSAVRAALAIHEKTAAANRQTIGDRPAIAVNIGINSGMCDVGSTKLRGTGGERWTYTATGPVTNLAARFCNAAQHGQILIGPETARRVRSAFPVRSLGPLTLKNVASPVEVWELESHEAHLRHQWSEGPVGESTPSSETRRSRTRSGSPPASSATST
jgi:class 3 adenylate cyclase/HAMP domain-containing protein